MFHVFLEVNPIIYENIVKVISETYSQKRSLVLSEKCARIIPTIHTTQIFMKMK